MSIESVILSNHPILCRPLLLLPSVFPSIRVFSSEFVLNIRWPKYWSFSFRVSPTEYSGLISFKIDWFDLLQVQGTLKSLLQHHNRKASFLQCSGFFVAHFSHLYMTARKMIALTVWAFVSEVISLLFNTLFRFAIAFLPTSKCINCMATVTVYSDFGAQKVKSVSPSPCHEMMRLDVMIFVL